MTEFHPLPTSTASSSSSEWWDKLNRQAEQRGREWCESAIMPSLDHLTFEDYNHVYEPSDDTYLLLDGLHYELTEGSLRVVASDSDKLHTVRCTLELGCGTGVPTVYLAKALLSVARKNQSTAAVIHVVTDVNPIALRVTQQTAQANNVVVESIQCDLSSTLLPRLAKSVDVLLFNPPYVPTPDDEVGSSGIEASWAGGKHGRRVIDRAIPQIVQLLQHPHGIAYMITVDDNLPQDLHEAFQSFGLIMSPLVRRKARNEYLTVQKITWIQEEDATS